MSQWADEGKANISLNKVDLGCFPSHWTLWQKIGVGVGAAMAVFIIVVAVIITKRSREMKWFMYYYLKLDTVPKDDRDENVENIKYDAFFCCRYFLTFSHC